MKAVGASPAVRRRGNYRTDDDPFAGIDPFPHPAKGEAEEDKMKVS